MNDSWMNKKMPEGSKPLTSAWYKGATTPRYSSNGEIYRVLTPPIGEESERPIGVRIGFAIVAVFAIAVVVLIVVGTAPAWMR